MGLGLNILTGGVLLTVFIFFVLIGILFLCASSKMAQVLEKGDDKTNNLEQLDSAYKSIKVAYILAFIAAAVTLILAILYASHESLFTPSEYWHLTLYLIIYLLLIISLIYAFMALNKLYDLSIRDRVGADAYIWAGLLLSLFAFVGLIATSSGRLGINIVKTKTVNRINDIESNINENLPKLRNKIEEIHSNVVLKSSPIVKSNSVAAYNAASSVPSVPSVPSGPYPVVPSSYNTYIPPAPSIATLSIN